MQEVGPRERRYNITASELYWIVRRFLLSMKRSGAGYEEIIVKSFTLAQHGKPMSFIKSSLLERGRKR